MRAAFPACPSIRGSSGSLPGRGVPRGRIDEITHDAICGAFSLAIENRRRDGDQDLAGEYEFDPFAMVKNGATADQ